MTNNPFDMGFREYFYCRPCCGCKQYDDCVKQDCRYGSTAPMILNRLEHIMVDNDSDCWEGENYD